jgi:hypothetical protein
MDRLYADVKYWGVTYCDAERIDNVWYYEDAFGGLQAFLRQEWVQPITELSEIRRHPPHLSGHTVTG